MDPVFWALILVLLGLLCAFLEVFIPSWGMLSMLAAGLMIGGIIFAFTQSGPLAGMLMLLLVTVTLPLIIYAAVKIAPHTPLGKRILNIPPRDEKEVLPQRESLEGLVGRQGRAQNEMLPSGVVIIDRRPYDALSQSEPIDAGQTVRVIAVRGHNLIVRPVRDETPPSAADQGDESLSRPIEELGLDDIDGMFS